MMMYMDEVAPGIKPAQRTIEFRALLDIYISLQPMYVVEIGSWKGGTLYHFLQNAPTGAHVVSIDAGPKNWRPAEPGFDRRIWDRWVPPGVKLHKILGYSTHASVIKKVTEICPHIDFIFIDGDHSYDGARADWANYSPMVRPGGVVAYHDLIAPRDRPRIQVGKFFRELKAAGYETQEFYSEPNQATMGIGCVYL